MQPEQGQRLEPKRAKTSSKQDFNTILSPKLLQKLKQLETGTNNVYQASA